jgi:hypothetical protein
MALGKEKERKGVSKMARSISMTPAKIKRYRVTFVGPKGGYHHAPFTFKLNQQVTSENTLKAPRSVEIMKKMNADGWLVRTVAWYNSKQMIKGVYPTMPNAILIYRLHKNDIYNSKLVKPGWKIVGEY